MEVCAIIRKGRRIHRMALYSLANLHNREPELSRLATCMYVVLFLSLFFIACTSVYDSVLELVIIVKNG